VGQRVESLSGDYVAGFVDGEGCFALKFRTDKQRNKDGTYRQYQYWGAEFAIVLHPLDAAILELIREKLGVGKISYKKAGDQVRLSVQSTQELLRNIIPFFEKYPLRGIKRQDFILWCKAVSLIANHKSKTRRGYSNPMGDQIEKELTLIKSKIDSLKRRGKESR